MKCISLKLTADVTKIRNLDGGLGFFCCQLTCQGGFVSRMQDTDILPFYHFMLLLSWICEEEADDLRAAGESHVLRNTSGQKTAAHPINISRVIEAGS